MIALYLLMHLYDILAYWMGAMWSVIVNAVDVTLQLIALPLAGAVTFVRYILRRRKYRRFRRYIERLP